MTGRMNGWKVKGLVQDSGCQITQIYPRWLAHHYTREIPAKVRCVHGDIRKFNTTLINLEIEGKTTCTRVVMNQELSSDRIVGIDVLPNMDLSLAYLATSKESKETKRRKRRRLRRLVITTSDSDKLEKHSGSSSSMTMIPASSKDTNQPFSTDDSPPPPTKESQASQKDLEE